jgi:hypothetical protein
MKKKFSTIMLVIVFTITGSALADVCYDIYDACLGQNPSDEYNNYQGWAGYNTGCYVSYNECHQQLPPGN